MERANIINFLKNNLTKNDLKYLEIGISSGTTFKQININKKYGVDPNPLYITDNIYAISSDSFFNQNNKKFDIIFIDGLHHSDQVLKDFKNSILNLYIPGFIIFDDVLPINESEQDRKERPFGYPWTGDVWKFIYFLILKYPNLKYNLHESSEQGFRSCLSIYFDKQINFDLNNFNYNNYNYEKDFSIYIDKLRKVIYEPNHIFLITSKIFNAELSLYTSTERFQQLKLTINSIKNKFLNVKIILIEGSLLNSDLENKLYDIGVNKIYYYPNNYKKSIGETYLLYKFCSENEDYIQNNTDFIHKLSGRYYFHDLKFKNLINYNKAVFKKVYSWKNNDTTINHFYYFKTVYYNFPIFLLNHFVEKLKYFLDNAHLFNDDDIEHLFFSHNIFPSELIYNANTLNIVGNIAPTKNQEII